MKNRIIEDFCSFRIKPYQKITSVLLKIIIGSLLITYLDTNILVSLPLTLVVFCILDYVYLLLFTSWLSVSGKYRNLLREAGTPQYQIQYAISMKRKELIGNIW